MAPTPWPHNRPHSKKLMGRRLRELFAAHFFNTAMTICAISVMRNRASYQGFPHLLARDAFVRTNRRAIATMFVHLSVCLSGTGVHCDHTVRVSADLILLLDSPMFCAPWHQSMSTYPSRLFPVPPGLEESWGIEFWIPASNYCPAVFCYSRGMIHQLLLWVTSLVCVGCQGQRRGHVPCAGAYPRQRWRVTSCFTLPGRCSSIPRAVSQSKLVVAIATLVLRKLS